MTSDARRVRRGHGAERGCGDVRGEGGRTQSRGRRRGRAALLGRRPDRSHRPPGGHLSGRSAERNRMAHPLAPVSAPSDARLPAIQSRAAQGQRARRRRDPPRGDQADPDHPRVARERALPADRRHDRPARPMVREVFKLAGVWADVNLWIGDTRARLNERVASVMLRFEDFFHQWFHEVKTGKATLDDVRAGPLPGRGARPWRYELGVRRSARGVPPRRPRRARRGRSARRHGQHDAVPRGAEPPPDRAHRMPAPRADGDEPGEPRPRERADQADLRDRQHGDRRAPLGREVSTCRS